MANGWFILMSLCVISVTAAPGDLNKAEKKRDQDCAFVIDGHRVDYQHLELFNISSAPCDRYRCFDGNYQKLSSGCDYEGECRDKDSIFVATDCNTYKCTLPYGLNGGEWRVTPIRTGCKDYHNICREPGDEFPYELNGVLYNFCTCHYIGDRSHVSCRSTANSPL